jgi:hypothetical protein
MHDNIKSTGKWLGSVITGYTNYYAVPGNMKTVKAFYTICVREWLRVLRGFTGTAAIEAGGFVHCEIVAIAPSSQGQQVATLSTAGLTPGTSQVKVVLYNNSGELLTETTAPINGKLPWNPGKKSN